MIFPVLHSSSDPPAGAKPASGSFLCPRAEREAFTLVELLVVVAIIALLLAIMAPSLTGARAQAQTAVCASQMKKWCTGLATYTAEFGGWLPGMNTSGVALRAKLFAMQSDPNCLRNPNLPVQPHDWATPILNLDMKLPGSRAERFRIVTEKYACPSQATVMSVLYASDESDGDHGSGGGLDSRRGGLREAHLLDRSQLPDARALPILGRQSPQGQPRVDRR